MIQIGLEERIGGGVEAACPHVHAPASAVVALAFVAEGVEGVVLVRITLGELRVGVSVRAVAIGRLRIAIRIDQQ